MAPDASRILDTASYLRLENLELIFDIFFVVGFISGFDGLIISEVSNE